MLGGGSGGQHIIGGKRTGTVQAIREEQCVGMAFVVCSSSFLVHRLQCSEGSDAEGPIQPWNAACLLLRHCRGLASAAELGGKAENLSQKTCCFHPLSLFFLQQWQLHSWFHVPEKKYSTMKHFPLGCMWKPFGSGLFSAHTWSRQQFDFLLAHRTPFRSSFPA